MTMLYKKKVYAYITREKAGVMQLLVFTHRDIPEAGIQVPGGTVDEGEKLEAAVLREVIEESGLRHLCIERFIDDYIIYMKEKQEYQKRHFFHISLLTNVKDRKRIYVIVNNVLDSFIRLRRFLFCLKVFMYGRRNV